MANGKFITLDGIDGAGKSTHLGFIAACCRERGVEVISTREPGGTPLGEKLREILLHEPMQGESEALLMFAARLEHLHTVIRPALTRGAWVISDRFTDATYAYQCGGRGLDSARLAVLEAWVQQGLQPDLTFLFDAPLDVAERRVRQGAAPLDKFEQEQAEFFGRVRSVYLSRAQAEPHRITLVDSTQTVEAIQVKLKEMIASL